MIERLSLVFVVSLTPSFSPFAHPDYQVSFFLSLSAQAGLPLHSGGLFLFCTWLGRGVGSDGHLGNRGRSLLPRFAFGLFPLAPLF